MNKPSDKPSFTSHSAFAPFGGRQVPKDPHHSEPSVSYLKTLFGSRFRLISPKVMKLLTIGILQTYRSCNPSFRYLSSANPRRVITKPSQGISNNNYDNINSDLIFYVNDVLGLQQKHKYVSFFAFLSLSKLFFPNVRHILQISCSWLIGTRNFWSSC